MSDIFFGSFGGKARKGRERREHTDVDLTVRSKPLPPYVPAAERRRARLERIRARERELGLDLTPMPPELLEDETTVLFAAIRAEVEAAPTLPTVADIVGSQPDITGGMDSVAYQRMLRS